MTRSTGPPSAAHSATPRVHGATHSPTTALGIGLVTADYLERLLTQRIDLERIRHDRILHEALPCNADPLRLALVFGIDHSTAMTYANLARQILSTDGEPTSSTALVPGRTAGS